MVNVKVYMYDLSGGMARQFSPMLLGTMIEAIWHTSILIDGAHEIYFDGGVGIATAPAGQTRFGRPVRVDDMGESTKTSREFAEWCAQQQQSQFGPNSYSLLVRNCNHFTDAALRFLATPRQLSADVTDMIPRILSTPLGGMLAPMLQGMTSDQQLVNGMQQASHSQQFLAATHGGPNPFMPTANAAPAPAASAATAAAATFDEAAWDAICERIAASKAVDSLASLSWVDSILQGGARGVWSPAHSGSNNAQLDRDLLAALGFRSSTGGSASYTFAGNADTLETGKMVVSSLLADLESRWSIEASAEQQQ